MNIAVVIVYNYTAVDGENLVRVRILVIAVFVAEVFYYYSARKLILSLLICGGRRLS